MGSIIIKQMASLKNIWLRYKTSYDINKFNIEERKARKRKKAN